MLFAPVGWAHQLVLTLSDWGDQVRAYLLAKANYALAVTIILCYTLFWQADNEARPYVPKSKRPKHCAWLTLSIKRLTDAIKQWEVGQKSRKKRTKRASIRYSPCTMAHRRTRAVLVNEVIAMQTHMSKHTNNASFDTDSGSVGIDNRCSGCMSDKASDFDGELRPVKRTIKGFGGSKTYNVMMGTLKWKIEDDDGKIHTFRIPNSYYVPDGGVRLLSPQHWAKTQKDLKPTQGTGTTTLSDKVTMFWNQRKYRKTIHLDLKTNVATMPLAPGYTRYHAFCAEADLGDEEVHDPMCMDTNMVSDDDDSSGSDSEDDTSVAEVPLIDSPREFDLDHGTPVATQTPSLIQDDEEDRQPSNVAAEFLKFHLKFNHCSPRKIQVMAEQGLLPKRLATCNIPVCSACQFGKASKRPWRQKTRKNGAEVEPAQHPGDVISVDQMISRTPGLIAQMAGFLTKDRYTCATVFVDHKSNLSYVHYQRSTSAKHTLEAKEAFERYSKLRGVTVRHYHADNGTFAANDWVRNCYSKGQGLTFASVNAHHQNGKAEVRIRHLQEMARTSMIHANKRWPDAISPNLWPYAVKMANDSINSTPWLYNPGKATPNSVYSNTDVQENPKHWYHFGCPVYVTDEQIQQGRRPKGGKWMERARIGVYLGRSPRHSKNVALVLNIKTGRVSPQFHFKMDPMFHTVKNATMQERTQSKWQEAAGFIVNKGKGSETAKDKHKTAQSDTPPHIPVTERSPVPNRPPEGVREAPLQPAPEGGTAGPQDTQPAPPRIDRASQPRQPARRSPRKRKGLNRLIEAMATELQGQEVPFEIFSLEALFPDEEEPDTLLAYKASADPDTMYMHEAMKEPDAEEFKKAMRGEMDAQLGGDVLELIHINDVPKTATLLPAVWQMKRKRHIKTREVYKWKARLNVDGSRMVHKRDYDQTYAPVASWNTIRLLLILVLVHNWHTKQLDYVLAFTQAPVDRDLYMKIPKGFEVEGARKGEHVFKIKKNTYGQKQAGRVWNKHLCAKLGKIGFQQSIIDECVFYKEDMIYVLYTDDSILAGPSEKRIARTIKQMQDGGLELTVEGDLEDFLGVNIDRNRATGEIHMTQPHLIESILQDLRLKKGESKCKDTPMKSSTILGKSKDSPEFDRSFNYRSVIGKMNYLEKGSRSELAYAIHQCARYSTDPRKDHGDAVRWIGRYLLGTPSKGLILRPDLTKSFEVFVDSDFCGNWHKKYAGEADSVRSRHGYIITYAGCPIVSKSQLQTEIALSTTEAEYTGLSYALREAIPLMELLKEMRKNGFGVLDHKLKVHCKVFEDNSGAIEMAVVHKWRPRTKHLATKLHHFRSYVNSGEVSVHKIDTSLQPADVLTKPLNVELLQRHRKTIMGW